jgi:menaquinone-dependent protoporphyrinogen oxidase
MKVLVAYGSKRGGTKGIAEQVRQTLLDRGLEVDEVPVEAVRSVAGYDAVVVGGALYAMRWPRSARRFVRRNARALSAMPVWMFSSGPLDSSASEHEIAPVKQVRRLMGQVQARGHVTFGGRLSADAQGFLASQMAKKVAGDWRDSGQVERWASDIADVLTASRTALG